MRSSPLPPPPPNKQTKDKGFNCKYIYIYIENRTPRPVNTVQGRRFYIELSLYSSIYIERDRTVVFRGGDCPGGGEGGVIIIYCVR